MLVQFLFWISLTIDSTHGVPSLTQNSDFSLKGSSQMLKPPVPSFLIQSPPLISSSQTSKKHVSLNPIGFQFLMNQPVHSCLKFSQVWGLRSLHSSILMRPTFVRAVSTSRNTTGLFDFIIIARPLHSNVYQMNFLLDPNPLPIGNPRKSNQYQYYEWQWKQESAALDKESERLVKMLADIVEEENKESKKITRKYRHHEGTFYDYSTGWKKRVEDRVRVEQVNQEDLKARKQVQQLCPFKPKNTRELSFFHEGPVAGWEDHFREYLKRKENRGTPEDEGATFHPVINEKSRKMMQGIGGKVEDRLLMYGEQTRLRQYEETVNQFSTSNNNYSFSTQQKFSTCAESINGTFNRLYKEGEELNKRRKEQELKEMHPFKPKTTKLPEQIQDRIMKQRKPLYYIKNALSQNNSVENEQIVNKPKGDFKSFMLRNQMLLDQRKKLMGTLHSRLAEKENKQKQQCTFSPALNKNSMRISQVVKKQNKEFEEKFFANVSIIENQPTEHKEFQPDINLSKLTIIDQKDETSYDDSDSLCRISESVKATKRKYPHHSELFQREVSVPEQEQDDNPPIQDNRSEINVSHKQATISRETGEMQDSIDRMRQQEWEAELSEIENHLESMMARARHD